MMVANVRQKGTTGLAWCSFIIAIIGGTLAAETFIGDALEWIVELAPWEWVPSVLLLAVVVTLAIDLFLDGIPNFAAIICALLGPTLATTAKGKLGDEVERGAENLLGWMNDTLVEWIGTTSTIGLALACIIGSLLMARRVIRKSAPMQMGM